NNQFLENIMECDPMPANAIAGSQSWNGSSYDSCIISQCAENYSLEENFCIENTGSVTVDFIQYMLPVDTDSAVGYVGTGASQIGSGVGYSGAGVAASGSGVGAIGSGVSPSGTGIPSVNLVENAYGEGLATNNINSCSIEDSIDCSIIRNSSPFFNFSTLIS